MKQVSRKLSRRILFQKLYADCFSENNKDLFNLSFIEGGNYQNEIDEAYISEMYGHIRENEKTLIAIIHHYAPKFDIEKMHLSYVIPLFIGITEMLYLKEEIPWKVSMNECIELAKVFSDDSGKKIVNGVINKVVENMDSIKNILPNEEKKSFSLFAKN